MIRSATITGILLIILSLSETAAQNNQVLYHMDLPQNHLLNPALRPGNSVYAGLPAITGLKLNVNNNFFNFSDVFIAGNQPSDSIISFLHPDYDVDRFLAKVNDRNYLEPQAAIQLLGLGFSAGRDMYIFMDLITRVEGNFVLPGDLLRLGLKGNEQFVGRSIDLSSFRADIRAYNELGLGFSRDITNRLRIGVKGKLLFGIATGSVNNKSLGIKVNEDYSHTLDADMTLNISGPVTVYTSQDNKIDSIRLDEERFDSSGNVIGFLTTMKNAGLGIDLGAEYRITGRLTLSASVTDLGYIRWKSDITNLRAESRFEFSGLNMLDVFNGTKTFEELGEETLDSLKNSLYVTDTRKPFTTYLSAGFSAGGKYNLTRSFSLGLLSYTRITGRHIREALTLSANLNLGNALSTTVSYTASNNRYDNLGAGVAFRAGIFQFYCIADRIPVIWNKIVIDNGSFHLPDSWNTIHAKLGMNLVFGSFVKKKQDKPMILVE